MKTEKERTGLLNGAVTLEVVKANPGVLVSSFQGRSLKGQAFEGPWPKQVSRCMSLVDLKGSQGGRV